MTAKTNAPSERTRLRRAHERGSYDRATLHAILDSTPLCHVGYLVDGKPAVTPTLQWREGDRVYWHGSSASRALASSDGAEVCLTVTRLDGLVLARSAFHHSVNYRSAMIFGRAEKIVDSQEKRARLRTFLETILPGRWETLRPMTDQEVKATAILSLALDEASAKIRTGDPKDDAADYALPIWAGVIPLGVSVGAPVADPLNLAGIGVPDHVTAFRLDRAG